MTKVETVRKEIDLQRELIQLQLEDLAWIRRERRRIERDRDAATVALRDALARAEAPFRGVLDGLTEDEATVKGEATQSLLAWLDARRAELIAGRECLDVQPPEGVRVQWTESPRVASLGEVPEKFLEVTVDMAAVKAALRTGADVAGITVQRTPVIVVAGGK